jgi:diaminohydroxyphosphoribosylaminopyrimidine deaminase/5-amino-6-(5-phosphoribosylamino)uracil reductase
MESLDFIAGLTHFDFAVGDLLNADQAMALAIQCAYNGAPFVSPNPAVGCVILNAQGKLLAKGHHEFFGGPHAEVNALKNLSHEDLKSAQVFVTLEPCAHEGKTPSCAKALAQLPIAKVVFGLVDPNPLVSGQGAEILRQAGIVVEEFEPRTKQQKKIKTELEEVCEVFLHNFRHKQVFTTIKMATSLDGQMALSNGQSQWITGSQARQHAHYLRSCYDALVVGRKTIENDDPQLNIRHPDVQKNNRIVILDPSGELDLQGKKVLSCHAAKDIFWCVQEGHPRHSQLQKQAEGLGVQLLTARPWSGPHKPTMNQNIFDLADLSSQLWSQGIRSLFIEGGATSIAHCLQQNFAQRLCLYVAPQILGQGLSWTKGFSLDDINHRIHLQNPKHQSLGSDIFWTGRLKNSHI